jgi:hypothetical protein
MLGEVRLCIACGVFSGSQENCRVPRLLHKAEHDSLLVWTQNQHQARTMWRPSQEELGVSATPSLRGLRRFNMRTRSVPVVGG